MRIITRQIKISSFQIIIGSFLAVILLGAFLLMLPISSAAGVVTPFSDALFTSTSAICVTGLVVHDTFRYWSLFGKICEHDVAQLFLSIIADAYEACTVILKYSPLMLPGIQAVILFAHMKTP